MKLNKEEFVMGLSFGAAFGLYIGVWAILTAPACAVLWALGGSGKGRAFRFLGVPGVAFLALGISWPSVLSAGLAALVLCQGYGIPSTQPKDEGSLLGRFFYRYVAKMRMLEASMWTRGTLAGLLAVAYIPVLGLAGRFFWFLAIVVWSHLFAVKYVEGEI